MSASDSWELISLFLLCLLAATIFPLSSEAVFLAALHYSNQADWLLLVVAGSGNTIGGLINYFLGFYGVDWWRKKQGKDPKIWKYKPWVERYGSLCALLSWVPIIGDPMLILLGVFKTPFLPVFFWMVLGKWGRYLILLFLQF